MRTHLLLLLLCLAIKTDAHAQSSAHTPASAPEGTNLLLAQYCVHCHSGDDAAGDIDLSSTANLDASAQNTSSAGFSQQFDVLARAADLLAEGSMPPQDEPQPSLAEKLVFEDWFETNFVSRIRARPATFRPRRLSANEYRNTLRTLVGFDLEVAVIEAEQTLSEKSLVMKLLPADPPGRSGFTNDTAENPISPLLWQRYSSLADAAIYRLMNERTDLVAYCAEDRLEPIIDFLTSFRSRVFRRTLNDAQQHRYQSVLQASHEDTRDAREFLERELKLLLMSPAFLYRGLLADESEKGPSAEDATLAVDAFEFAERLSYFLWADMPDEELMRLAASGRLLEREISRRQIQRMLADPKARSLSEDFAGQWLSLSEIESTSNNPPVMLALKSQPHDFLHYLFVEDRPLLELLDSNTSFINPHTARFYPAERKQLSKYRKQKGIEVEALPNQRVLLAETSERGGGLLTMPGVLAMNRGPILRGTWLLERILGEHLPDPPPNVGAVPPSPPGQKLSFRERFEQHRSQRSCAVCHDKIDPLGFSLEAFDGAGNYKKAASYQPSKKDRKLGVEVDRAPDTSGKLPSGETFDDFQQLKNILVTERRKQVVENITRKLMEYALCRKLEYFDKPTVDNIVEELLQREGGTYQQLIHLICESLPFTHTFVESED